MRCFKMDRTTRAFGLIRWHASSGLALQMHERSPNMMPDMGFLFEHEVGGV